jgi:hypothetical protein
MRPAERRPRPRVERLENEEVGSVQPSSRPIRRQRVDARGEGGPRCRPRGGRGRCGLCRRARPCSVACRCAPAKERERQWRTMRAGWLSRHFGRCRRWPRWMGPAPPVCPPLEPSRTGGARPSGGDRRSDVSVGEGRGDGRPPTGRSASPSALGARVRRTVATMRRLAMLPCAWWAWRGRWVGAARGPARRRAGRRGHGAPSAAGGRRAWSPDGRGGRRRSRPALEASSRCPSVREPAAPARRTRFGATPCSPPAGRPPRRRPAARYRRPARRTRAPCGPPASAPRPAAPGRCR